MPGSDVISLELNIRGMTEPNKAHDNSEDPEPSQISVLQQARSSLNDIVKSRYQQ